MAHRIGVQVDIDGGRGDGCSETGYGQLYTRYTEYKGYCAIMYMWYFPMDKGSGGIFAGFARVQGHRHAFESVIVWTSSCNATSAEMFAVSYSIQGGYVSYIVNPKTDPDIIDGGHGNYYPEVTYAYHSADDVSTHYVDQNQGTDDPSKYAATEMIEWGQLPYPAKSSLENTDWRDATCMMCGTGPDGTFTRMIDTAWKNRGHLWGNNSTGEGVEGLLESGQKQIPKPAGHISW